MVSIKKIIGFEWDKGNLDKNWLKHSVTAAETEQIFFNHPLLLLSDPKHSQAENRSYALGRTDNNRLLFISFTIRKKQLIRVISARTMSRKERQHYYEQATKKNP